MTLKCPHCHKHIPIATIRKIISNAGKEANALRKTQGAGPGRPKKLAPCPECGEELGVAERRKHKC